MKRTTTVQQTDRRGGGVMNELMVRSAHEAGPTESIPDEKIADKALGPVLDAVRHDDLRYDNLRYKVPPDGVHELMGAIRCDAPDLHQFI